MSISDKLLAALGQRDVALATKILTQHPYLFHFETAYGWPVPHCCLPRRGEVARLDVDLMRLFVAEGGNVNLKTDSGVSLLFLATIGAKCEPIADFLVSCGAQMSSFERAVVAIHKSADDPEGGERIFGDMLHKEPGMVRETGDKGFTLLHHALREKQYGLAKLLIERGADVNAVTCAGWSPLGLCRGSESDDIACRKALLAKGAQYTIREELVEFIQSGRDDDFIRTLEANPPLVNSWAPTQGPLIHNLVVFSENVPLLEYLLSHGVDANVIDQSGRTALHKVGDKLDFVPALLTHGADINKRDFAGWTPLHLAISKNSEELVKLLVGLGADINAESDRGETPLDRVYALKFSNRERLARWLKSNGARRGKSN